MEIYVLRHFDCVKTGDFPTVDDVRGHVVKLFKNKTSLFEYLSTNKIELGISYEWDTSWQNYAAYGHDYTIVDLNDLCVNEVVAESFTE